MDVQEGHGEEHWIDGSSYTGSYVKGLKSGEGKFVWSDGSFYCGQFSDNSIHGEGTYVWPDGKSYAGERVSTYTRLIHTAVET